MEKERESNQGDPPNNINKIKNEMGICLVILFNMPGSGQWNVFLNPCGPSYCFPFFF